MWTFIALAFSLILCGYLYVKSKQKYWGKRGVPHPQPTFLLGNFGKGLTMSENMGDVITKIYRNFSDCKYVGFYKFLTPSVIVRDPELIRKVMVKDFDYFEANDIDVDDDPNNIFGKNPFVLRGHIWKVVRTQLTPNFTALRLKKMFPLIEEVSDKLVSYVNKKIDQGQGKCLDAKDVSVKFTTENVASCAFGLNGQAFEDTESEFVRVAKDIGGLSLLQAIKFFIIIMIPSLSKLLKIRFLSKESEDYLVKTVAETLRYRQENNVVRHDFLDMMRQLKETCTAFEFTDRDVVGHSASFFADGVETSGGTLSYIMFELATHSDVQQQLYEEIQSVLNKNNGNLSYEALQQMNYLDCVFNETLRKNSMAMTFFKRCTKDYKFPAAREDAEEVYIQADMTVIIPVEALHHDPEYYPEPEKFKPERFLEENKEQLVRTTYLAFGEGPRLCLGMRFGTFQIKMAVIGLIKNFVITLNNKTQTPLVNNPHGLIRNPIGGIWVDFKKRD